MALDITATKQILNLGKIAWERQILSFEDRNQHMNDVNDQGIDGVPQTFRNIQHDFNKC